MRIIIGGDFVVSKTNEAFFESGEINKVFSDDLLNVWFNHDFRAFNLEQPLIDLNNKKKIEKSGPHLSACSKCINGIKKMDPSLIFLANNHIKDFDSDGIETTINTLTKNGIDYIGVGSDLKDAQYHSVFIKDDVAIINCCEHEFSGSINGGPGANLFDDKWMFNEIKKAKERQLYIIVVYHGGKEEYRYPTPYLKLRCELLAEFGCNLILCQHSHCIGAYQKHNDCTIVYGQGNFIFKDYKKNDFWETGLLISLDTCTKLISYIPIKSGNKQIELLHGEEKESVIENFDRRSKKITDDSFVFDNYLEYLNKRKKNYLCNLFGFSKLRKFFEIKIFKGRFLFNRLRKKRGTVLMNMLECEAHSEAIKTIIRNEYEKRNK